MQVSMFGRRGGVRVWVRHMNFSAFWGSNSRALGLKNSSHLIKYPFLRLTKPQFGAKFVAKLPRNPQKSPEIPREGTEEVFKSDTYASKPPPPPSSLPRLDTATCIMSECSEQPPPLVLTMLGVVRLRAGTWKAVCWKLARSASRGWWEDRRAQAAGSFLRPRFT